MEATSPVLTSPLDEADIEPWLRLLDRLDVTLMSAGGPEALRLFRALGPRRRADAHRRLVRERQKLVVEIEAIGVRQVGGRMQPAASPYTEGGLDTDYAKLAEAFATCATLAHRQGWNALKQWLLERARMHRLHAQFLVT